MHYNFERRKVKLSQLITQHSQRLQQQRSGRLFVGLSLFGLLIAVSSFPSQRVLLGFTLMFALAFFFLVQRSRQQQKFLKKLQIWHDLIERQHQRQQGTYKSQTPFLPKDLSEEQQLLSDDLHLFGSLSLFSMIDESLSAGGRQKLKKWMLTPLHNQNHLEQRQKTLQSLSSHSWPIIKTCLIGGEQKEAIDTSTLLQDLESPFVPESFYNWLKVHLILFPLCWTLVFLGWSQTLPINPQLPFAIYLIFSLYSLKVVQHSFGRINSLSLQISQLMPIFSHLERISERPIFNEILKNICSHRPSQTLKSAERFISWLNTRNHPMLYLLVNSIAPWDFVICFLAERWRRQANTSMHSSFDDLYRFEALSSLALMAHFQTQSWPTFHNNSTLTFTNMFHPLIARHQAVANSFSLEAPCRLALITGSNMSGKSTFMRTVALNQILALMGAPIFAENFDTHITNIRTCLKVTDSLESGYSTFYFEVRRMAEIVKQSQSSENFLFFVDEIFRGTNHDERVQGSQAILKSLAQRKNVQGFVSTHDLELVELSNQYESLGVWHFRDDVVNGELSFSYKIHPEVGPTTNALVIMRNAGLPV